MNYKHHTVQFLDWRIKSPCPGAKGFAHTIRAPRALVGSAW